MPSRDVSEEVSEPKQAEQEQLELAILNEEQNKSISQMEMKRQSELQGGERERVHLQAGISS